MWHVFYEDDNGQITIDCIPENGQNILFYEHRSGWYHISTWDDDSYYEFCETEDGDKIEDGDAWMELPDPPKGE